MVIGVRASFCFGAAGSAPKDTAVSRSNDISNLDEKRPFILNLQKSLRIPTNSFQDLGLDSSSSQSFYNAFFSNRALSKF